ncbi:MAG: methyl-accepting chemotaxis protein, partial [Xanthobacteraceae bacterium]
VATGISAVTSAVRDTNASSRNVAESSDDLSATARQLADRVNAFFVELRTGPLDRRKEGDPGYRGPERRQAQDLDQRRALAS